MASWPKNVGHMSGDTPVSEMPFPEAFRRPAMGTHRVSSTVENYWFAEFDDEAPSKARWRPTLDFAGRLMSTAIWFDTKAECEQFIQSEILGARVHFDAIPNNIVWVTVSPVDD